MSNILGFSQELCNHPNCKEYVKHGLFGYIGHALRTPNMDEFLEKSFKDNNWNLDYLATWITSSHGRHLLDELYELDETEHMDFIKSHLTEIYNKGLIYSQPSHKGTLNDTIRLQEELKDQLL